MNNEIIKFEKVSKSYRKALFTSQRQTVFNDIDFVLKKGEICALFGESGCGKSTVLRLFMELAKADSGTIYYQGRDIKSYNKAEKKQIHREVQIVFQDPNDAFHLKWRIKKALSEPLKLYNSYEEAEFNKNCQQYMRLLGLEENYLERYPYQLSGGQIQRLAFLRALLLKPKCIFLDEATSMLDVSVQARFMTIVKKLNQLLGMTFLLVSHDKELVKQCSDRVYLFADKELKAVPIEEL